MAAYWTSQATKTLAARISADTRWADFDPTVLYQILVALIDALLDCRPTPDQGFAWLTWRPKARPVIDWLLGTTPASRLYDYRETIVQAMWRKWTGNVDEFRAFVPALWASVDAGDLSADLMTQLYAEARSR